jgi:uncharacterized protein YjbI with pentapeptide repeats
MPAEPRTPDAPDLPRQLEPGVVTALADGASIAEAALRDAALTGQHARGVVIEAATLDGVDLSASRLDQLSLIDVRATGGNLANPVCRGARAVRVELAGVRLTGLGLRGAELHDVVVRDCRADLTSFGEARLERVWFEDCDLTEADFTGAQLTAVRFADCDLSRADFQGARLSSCEMRGVRLAGLHGVERLRGVALPWPDVVENTATWAAALGLRVLDD